MFVLVVTPHLSDTMVHFWRKAVPLHLEPFISNDFISTALTQEKSQSESSAGALKEKASYSKERCPGLLCSKSGKLALDTTVDMSSDGWPDRVRKGEETRTVSAVSRHVCGSTEKSSSRRAQATG